MIGVYSITGRDGWPLYVGSSRNVERRIREHRRGEWGAEIGRVEMLPCDSWTDALRLEKVLIKDLNPTHNHQGLDPLEQAATFAEFAEVLGVTS
jgi:excinuclease UvrABC nuclease subunit